jgi:hypothetical protein
MAWSSRWIFNRQPERSLKRKVGELTMENVPGLKRLGMVVQNES